MQGTTKMRLIAIALLLTAAVACSSQETEAPVETTTVDTTAVDTAAVDSAAADTTAAN